MRIIALLITLLLAIPLFACDAPEADEAGDEGAELAEAPDDDHEHGDDHAHGDDHDHDHAHGDDHDHDHDDDGHTHDHEAEEELATDLEPGETRHFGAPFTIEDDPIELADALETVGDSDGDDAELIKVNARVEQACEKKGCWFTLETDDVDIPVRVRMQDYGFFVSRNSAGAEATLEGTLTEVTLSEEEAQHFAEDAAEAGEDPEEVEGEQQNYQFVATGVEMTQPES